MKATLVAFGLLEIDGVRFERDVVIDRGRVRKRDKKASKPLRDRYGHTPLSLLEPIPWDCRRLVVGTGADGALPIDGRLRGGRPAGRRAGRRADGGGLCAALGRR